MTECPDCKSNNVSSKGYREGSDVHRYICKKCGRNFSVAPFKPEQVKAEKVIKANQTLNVTTTTKENLLKMKIHSRETIDDIINRLISNYKATIPE